jgi:hypothetical protein
MLLSLLWLQSKAATNCQPGEQMSYLAGGSCITGPIIGYSGYSCFKCAPGCYKADIDNHPSYTPPCIPCPTSTYSPIGSAVCEICPPGYGRSSDNSICTSCSPGFYAGGSTGGTSQCTSCPIGTTSIAYGNGFSSSCSICASGYFGTPISPGLSSNGCTLCPAGTWSSRGSEFCSPCPPGTYSLSGAGSCSLCPTGTFGSRAGLQSETCSGVCIGCPSGSTIAPSSALTCVSDDARAISSSLGMLLWPAAHPNNPHDVDLIIAPADVCANQVGFCCEGREHITINNIQRFVIGTASELHMEEAEVLTCN